MDAMPEVRAVDPDAGEHGRGASELRGVPSRAEEGSVIEAEEEAHRQGCPCVRCQCRRFLSYRPPEDQKIAGATMKIAAYGGVMSGSGEPDRHYDVVVTHADLTRALGMVESPFLREVGRACREIGPPPTYEKQPWGMTRPARFVVAWLAVHCWADWQAARDEHPEGTLGWLLDQVAQEMAEILGAGFGNKVEVRRAVEQEPPPEIEANLTQEPSIDIIGQAPEVARGSVACEFEPPAPIAPCR